MDSLFLLQKIMVTYTPIESVSASFINREKSNERVFLVLGHNVQHANADDGNHAIRGLQYSNTNSGGYCNGCSVIVHE